MALVERADRLHALIEQAFQHRAGVPWGAAHQKILRRLAPAFGKPVEIGLEAAGGGDHLFRRHGLAAGKPDTFAEPVIDQDIRNLGVIVKRHAQPFGMTAQAVQQRPSATQEKGVGTAEIERARQRRLEPDTTLAEPGGELGRLLQRQPGELLVGDTARHPHQILEILFEAVGVGQHVGRLFMHGPQIARVAGVAAAHVARCGFENQHRASGLGRGDGGAQAGVAGPDDQHVPAFRIAVVVTCIHLYTGT